MTAVVKCPKCGSEQIAIDRRKAANPTAGGGTFLTCGIGLPPNFNEQSDLDVICMKCGTAWNPKRLLEKPTQLKKSVLKPEFIAALFFIILLTLVLVLYYR